MGRSLSDFIRDELASTEKGPCVMLSLVLPSDNDREVKSIRITGESDISPEQRAKTFVDLAEEDAQEIDAISVVYSVRSFFENGGGQYVGRMALRVKGNKDAEDLENASESGERMQRMRHKEDVHDAVIKMAGITYQTLLTHTRQMADDRHKERSENVELFGALKEVLMAKALDGHTFRMAEKKYERTTAVIEKGMGVIMPMARMLGAPVPEDKADTDLLNAVIDSIDATDSNAVNSLRVMLAKLDPTVAMLLAERFERRAKQKAEETLKREQEREVDRKAAEGEGEKENVH